MDNALIDDQRIHVDLSQSVAKLWSQYMRKDNKGNDISVSICYFHFRASYRMLAYVWLSTIETNPPC